MRKQIRKDGKLGLQIVALALLMLLIGASLYTALPSLAQGGTSLTQGDFSLAAEQGFGDRQNSWAWSMQWWNGHLYVGTNRAWHCAETASLARIFSGVEYPPTDPDVQCTPLPEDLPLQAEIWRWSPSQPGAVRTTGTWERVYQAPANVPLPSNPNKFIARDIGYRGMIVFTEANGTEALYVTGVSPQFIGFDGLNRLPARILRSTDGIDFTPIPQDPGTILGSSWYNTFRNPISYKGHFYVTGGTVQGSGVLLESTNPAGGNDNFRTVSPAGMVISDLAVYHQYLYVGVNDRLEGYAIYKTDASGELPYTFTPVVEKGGYLPDGKNSEILSMEVFDGKLYAGGNGIKTGSVGPGAAAEVIRINEDDSWDLVVGYPRLTPRGYKYPISGLMAGFGNVFNAHMWRMITHEGVLYVGTFDSSTTLRDDPQLGEYARQFMGFDLYSSTDGIHFTPVTTDGFGDGFNFGARTFASTPYGLFLGTANYYYGLQIWLGVPGAPVNTPTPTGTLPTPTSTATPETPPPFTSTPTVTGTPPTATPTNTGTPGTPPPFTSTPTVTGTPPTATPTPPPPEPPTVTPTPITIEVPVMTRWNLFSIPLNMANSRIEDVMTRSGLNGLFELIMSFEREGLTYYPGMPQFNTLTVFDSEHGYWIYIDESALQQFMTFVGQPAPSDSPIHLEQGWNLVSYLASVTLPVDTALTAIAGKYTKVLGYDGGAMSYDLNLPPSMWTLNQMQPFQGYWIHMTESAVLNYPAEAFGLARRAAVPLPVDRLSLAHPIYLPLIARGLAPNRPQVSPDIASTNQWINVYSLNTTLNGQAVPANAVITAVGEDGRKLGEVPARQDGSFGVLAVYGDDPHTPVLDGARPGERIGFLINGRPAAVTNGAGPVWTVNGDLISVDLAASE